MSRIGKFAVALWFLAAPAIAEDGRYDLICHGTHTIFLDHGMSRDAAGTTLSVDLSARRICEHPCTYPHRITSLSDSEVTVNGIKPRVVALDEIKAYAHGAISLDGAAYDESNAVLILSRNSEHLTWTTPLKLRNRTAKVVVEADCMRAAFSTPR
jgi:hypothetical protein